VKKAKKRGPLLVHKAEKFLSLERQGSNNQSELSLKLPDIRSRVSRDLSINYTEERKERLRAKLEALYNAHPPKLRMKKEFEGSPSRASGS